MASKYNESSNDLATIDTTLGNQRNRGPIICIPINTILCSGRILYSRLLYERQIHHDKQRHSCYNDIPYYTISTLFKGLNLSLFLFSSFIIFKEEIAVFNHDIFDESSVFGF